MPSPLLRLLRLVAVLALVIHCGGSPEDSPRKRFREGAVDLGGLDFKTGRLLPLSGPWIFHPGRLATNGGEMTDAGRAMLSVPDLSHGKGSRLVTMPHLWDRPLPLASTEPVIRYGTYVLFLRNAKPGLKLALSQKRIHSAFRLWVVSWDGGLTLLGDSGRVAVDKAKSRPAMRRTVGSLPDAENHALILEVCDYWTNRGGVWEPLLLGSEHSIRKAHARFRAWDYWVLGIIFVMGIYHMILFSLRRSLVSAFYLALSCFALVLYGYAWGDFLQTDEPDLNAFAVIWKLRHGTYPILGLTLVYYAFTILGRPFWRSGRLAVLFWNLAVILFIAAASPQFITRYQFLIDLGVYLCIMYGIPLTYYLLWRSTAEERKEAWVVILSAHLLAVCGVSDILMTFGIHPGPRVYHYGATVWMLGQAYLIAARFARARAAAERVSGELQKVDRLKDQFLANTSHELRTPLHGITGIVESLMNGVAGDLNGTMRSNLGLVASSGKRLLTLVNDILDFSKLKQGDITLRREAVDLAAAIRVVVELSRPLLRGDQVTLTYHESPLPAVHGDEDRLQQILFNLVGNAIKFTDKGAVTISAESTGGEWVRVIVSDSGIGIPPDKHEAIFETFSQADGSTARDYGGTGLGLSITRQLVELHGGTLELESAPGKGAVFSFTVPAAQREIAPKKPAENTLSRLLPETLSPTPDSEASKAKSASGPVNHSAFHVLAVDDDPVNLQVLRNHLSLQGFRVTTVAGGDEALAAVKSDRVFDIVLLDVMMPRLSGFDVCRELRREYSRSELPIILLTAKNRVSDLVTGLNNGANDYLTKPFDSRELLARVGTLMELKIAAKSQSDLAALRSELELARSIQLSLLPKALPRVPGLRVAARYRAMESVGGDFYTFSSSEDDLFALITDVSGHGVPAALIVSMVHLAFSFQTENLSRPDIVLADMNRILYGHTDREFITGCYVHLDRKNSRLITVNAGHPPVFVWKKREGRSISLRPHGRIIGFLPEVKYETEEIALEPGDRILMYTDGALEAQSPDGGMLGEEGLRKSLAKNEDLDPEQFAEHLIKLLVRWSGGDDKLEDDIALVVIDVLPSDQ